MRLSELKTGESATILKVTGHGGFRRRIMEMGFVRGQRVEVMLNAPLKDPIEYKIMGYAISLRRSEAEMVVVLSDSELNEYLAQKHAHHRHEQNAEHPFAQDRSQHEADEEHSRAGHGRLHLHEGIGRHGIDLLAQPHPVHEEEPNPSDESQQHASANALDTATGDEHYHCKDEPEGSCCKDEGAVCRKKREKECKKNKGQSFVPSPENVHPESGPSEKIVADNTPFSETPDEEDDCMTADEVIKRHSRIISVALVGNPNSGKTSLFNAISGGHEHVGNYSGVTVGAKIGFRHYRGYRFDVTDLPGTYALSAYTPEERYVRSHIARETPDVIINSVVASNLERNLYLTTELIDINPRMVVALNMYDELNASGAKLDYENLGRMLGVPMVPVEARNGKGIDELLDTVIAVYENEDKRVRHIHINMGPVIEEGVQALRSDMSENRGELPKAFPPRYYAMKMLEGDRQVEERLRDSERYPEWVAIRDREAKRITTALGEDVETAFANQKYGFIQGALKETFVPGKHEEASATKLIDTFVTHKLWGFPIFFFLMWLMFWCTFSLGAYPQEWIDAIVGWIGQGVNALMPEGPLRDLLSDGIIGGVGAVIVFLPNIMILYLFISFMEDSGYLARAAFIMDRVMHRIGLHGKSFIPLIMGFGCNVPAIMASRTIESRSSRLITILITPFMSCSARIPIYILLTGTFFAANASLVMIGLYVLGVVLAIVTARLMRRFMFPVDETPFVMELPPYRLPTWKTTLSHMWDKCSQYLRKMGGMILIASVVVWFLSYYPRTDMGKTAEHYENSYLGRLGKSCEPVFSPLGLNWKAGVAILSGVPAKEIVVSTLSVLYSESGKSANPSGEMQFVTDSGEKIEIRGAAPEEVTVIGGASGPTEINIEDDNAQQTTATKQNTTGAHGANDAVANIDLNTASSSAESNVASESQSANNSEDETQIVIKDSSEKVADLPGEDQETVNLSRKLLASGDFTQASALAFLVFILLYFPCIATIAAIGAEAGWKWAAGAVVYNTILAWVVSWAVYRLMLWL